MEGDLKELPDNIGLDRQQVISSWWSCQLLRIRTSTPKGQNYEVKKWLLSTSGESPVVTRQYRVSSLGGARGDKHVSAIAWIDNGPAHCWGLNGANHRLIMDLVLKTVSLILKVVSLSQEMMIYKKKYSLFRAQGHLTGRVVEDELLEEAHQERFQQLSRPRYQNQNTFWKCSTHLSEVVVKVFPNIYKCKTSCVSNICEAETTFQNCKLDFAPSLDKQFFFKMADDILNEGRLVRNQMPMKLSLFCTSSLFMILLLFT